ncbi:hypothetical protein FOL47_010811 [Perkinsus chesapeaki]|uniref:Aminoglycoside phosphotransferase domain-containing protein n=1 Tax=Perkinsus chesapeaki TaxID=330153 RepID=A0A7J6L255_PERCH|nr:hypothetical protein FOL47_010811 [Perkinsus chesapeaki]
MDTPFAVARFLRSLAALLRVVLSIRPYLWYLILQRCLLINVDRLRVYIRSILHSPQTDHFVAAALEGCGVTYLGDEVVTGGYVTSVKRVYVDQKKNVKLPDSVIMKSLSSNFYRRLATCGIYQREVRFYNEVARTLPIPIPRVHSCKWDNWRCSGLIILEDLKTGVLMSDKLLTHEDPKGLVSEAMRVAARMHAKYWGATPSTLAKSSLGKYPWLKGYDYIQGRNKGMYASAKCLLSFLWDKVKRAILEGSVGEREYGVKLRGELVEFVDKAIEASTWDAYQNYLKTSKHPLTFIHGDYYTNNQLWDEETKRLYTVDWSEVSVGEGPADIALYFFGYPQVAKCRKWEEELIRIYWKELGAQGVDLSSYPLSMCREAYVRGGIDKGIQRLIMAAVPALYCPALIPVPLIQGVVDQVDAFVTEHKMEYRSPYLLATAYFDTWITHKDSVVDVTFFEGPYSVEGWFVFDDLGLRSFVLYLGLQYQVMFSTRFKAHGTDHFVAAALEGCGVTYLGDEVVTGGYATSVKRVYVDQKKNVKLPDSVIMKSLLLNFYRRLATCGAYQREVRFYNEVARTLPIPIPRVYFCKWDNWRCSGLIILEDLKTGVLVSDKLITHEDPKGLVSEAMRVAARMHAKYWGATPSTLAKSSLGKYPWLKGYDYIQGRNKGMYASAKSLMSFLWDKVKMAFSEGSVSEREYGVKLRGELVEFVDKAIEASTWDAYQNYLKTSKHPLTLIHGDYYTNNQLWDEETKRLYTVDWSQVSVGEGPADIAEYFFGYPQVAKCRKWEEELIRIYWKELGAQGVDLSSYPLSMCREAYVRGGIDKGIQRLIIAAVAALHSPALIPVPLIQGVVDQVDAFVTEHKMEYCSPYLLTTAYFDTW